MKRRYFLGLLLGMLLTAWHTNVWLVPKQDDDIVLERDADIPTHYDFTDPSHENFIVWQINRNGSVVWRQPSFGLFAASGDRKVKIQEIRISTGNPVPWSADWQMFVEDKVGGDRYVTGGQTTGNFGTPAAFNAMTGSEMRAAVKAAVIADAKVPANDSVN